MKRSHSIINSNVTGNFFIDFFIVFIGNKIKPLPLIENAGKKLKNVIAKQ